MYRLLKRADLIMVATEGHISGSNYLPEFRGKCAIIPFGVDSALLKKSESAYGDSNSLGAPVRFLFVGRLIYYKGCETLLDAFSKIHGAELVLVGEGPLEYALKTQAERNGISDRVRFAGSISDEALADEFAACDVFVLPSIAKSEAFGLVQIEAMAYGKPVINTNLPSGVPYVSLDGVTGLTVAAEDAQALAEAMQTLVDDPALRLHFGKAAYKRAREEYSMDIMLDRVMEQYEKLMKS
jgi:rhamnosyl/mannosyltransferase